MSELTFIGETICPKTNIMTEFYVTEESLQDTVTFEEIVKNVLFVFSDLSKVQETYNKLITREDEDLFVEMIVDRLSDLMSQNTTDIILDECIEGTRYGKKIDCMISMIQEDENINISDDFMLRLLESAFEVMLIEQILYSIDAPEENIGLIESIDIFNQLNTMSKECDALRYTLNLDTFNFEESEEGKCLLSFN